MSRPIIEVQNLSKRYELGRIGATRLKDDLERSWSRLRGRATKDQEGEFWALKDVSFDIQPGEAVGVIGRNGAGKSTLLKILSRITDPSSGEAILRGRVASLLEVGTGFHPDLTGRENVYLNGAILGMTRSEVARKFDEIVAFAEVEQFINTPVKRYSSGMYVRLAFAVAAHLEPEILIIDEVLAVGDAQFQKKCIGRMQEISHGHGRTVLFVSHSMTTIRRLCRHCLVLDSGKSRGVLPIDEAIDQYNSKIKSTGLDVDVGTRQREWGTTAAEARILRIRAVTEKGLFFGEPLTVELTIQVNSSFESLMVGFAMNTVEGQRVMTLDSDSTQKGWQLGPGIHRVTLHLPRLPVSPGSYYCSAAIGQGRYFCDIIEGFALWDIHPGAGDSESDRGFGGCRMPVEASVSLV